MDEFKIIRCLMDMLKQNPVHEYTVKERLIAKRLFKEIKLAQEDDPIFYNIVKQNPSADFVVALQFIFSEGKYSFGRIISAYGYTAYCTIYHDAGSHKILKLFDNFYLNNMKPWLDYQRLWTRIYAREKTKSLCCCNIL